MNTEPINVERFSGVVLMMNLFQQQRQILQQLPMYEANHKNQFENNPLSSNLPSQLTMDGIRQLFTVTSNQQYIFQIIKIIQNYEENRLCQLSDGFCYVTCLLSGEARVKNIKGELEVFDVIRISKQDIIILGLQRTPSLELCNVNIIGIRLLCMIGEPVAYMTYFHNNFQNRKGSIQIADGQRVQSTSSIRDLVENYPHVPTKWILKAKIVKISDSINFDKPFMVIRLMDQKQQMIEGVFFGHVALEAHKKLSYNKQYLFSNGQVKTKKNNIKQFEIKFTEQSQIIPIQSMKSALNEIKVPQAETTIRDISQKGDYGLVTLTAKVLRVKILSKGRSLNVLDKNNDIVEIVLWEEIKDEAKQGVTYVFANLRIKKGGNLSLQSVRNKTSVTKSQVQLERQNNQNKGSLQKDFKQISTFKQFKDINQLINVSEAVELNIKEREYRDITGFLVINTMYMQNKHFFKIECPNCNGQEISANPLMCKKCSSNNPVVRWNVRAHILDQKEDIKCIINEELCEKLFKMTSLEGFRKLAEDKDSIKKKVEQISHLEGIFKLKINPYKDNMYFNVIQIYRNNSQAILKKVYKDLKLTIKKYLES